MADHKGHARASSPRSAPRVISPRNKVNVALPFAKITLDEPGTMRVGDWISLAGLAVTAIGFSVVVWEITHTANGSQR